MSSVAEALLASGSKKLPLLPPPPKIKKPPKTFRFELELAESNEKTYPEFSWAELVRNAKQKELAQKAEKGTPTLNPYASDDEEDLKAMAAKFEAKYSTTAPSKKKKRRAEDYCIDKGAGYDETDPFIDNSDVYDEVVPVDLQTVHGGFYINSGSLDFKEVELSEDEEDSLSQPPKVPTKIKKAKTKIGTGLLQKPKNPVGRPPGVGNRSSLDKSGLPKKRKLPIIPGGKVIPKAKKMNVMNIFKPQRDLEVTPVKPDVPKPKVRKLSSSSGSSSSSSSEDGSSSSSESDSSSSEGTEKAKEAPKVKNSVPVKPKAAVPTSATAAANMPKPNSSGVIRQTDSALSSSIIVQGMAQQPKRLKTKNVPLNPKLHPNLTTSTGVVGASMNIAPPPPPPPQMQSKVLNKDLIKTNGGSNSVNSRTTPSQSPSGMMHTPTSSPSLKIPPPKPVSTTSMSPGLSISSVTPQASKNANSIPNRKPKMKNKPAISANSISPSQQIDLYGLAAAGYGMPNLSNFAPNLSPNTSIMKTGINLMSIPKAMPNLKKMTQASSSSVEKLNVHKQPKAATQKPVKTKAKHPVSSNPVATSSISHTSAFGNIVTSSSNFLSNMSTYKSPPPLGGPGVDIISKTRNNAAVNSGVNSTTKTNVSNVPSFSPGSSLNISNVSLAHTSNSNALTTSSLLSAAGISSILSSSPNLVNSVPSSLTVQRIPQSITITPSSQPPTYPSVGITNSNKSLNVDIKTNKHISAFDVQALLNTNPVVSYANTLVAMGKTGAGKSTNSIANNSRDAQRK